MGELMVFLIYKMVGLAVGFGFALLGYKLFVAGVWGNAGTFQASFENNELLVKNAAPGTFFAIAGAIIVVVVIFKGLEVKLPDQPGSPAAAAPAPPADRPIMPTSKPYAGNKP